MFQFRRNDIYLVLAVAVITLFLFGWQYFTAFQKGAEVVVQRDGETIGSYSLAKEQHLTFTDEDGRKNRLVIQDGKAYMEDADCPDRLCVKQGPIEKTGESIICLPHKLVIQVTGGEVGETDA